MSRERASKIDVSSNRVTVRGLSAFDLSLLSLLEDKSTYKIALAK